MASSRSVDPSWAPLEQPWRGFASDPDTTLRETSLPTPSSQPSESPLTQLWLAVQQWVGFFRGLTLAAGSALSCGVAAGGLALLLFLAVTLTFAPATDTFSRRLDLDFSLPDMAAEAVFLPEAQLADGLPPADPQRDARQAAAPAAACLFLPPQQAMDVWVELEIPRGSSQGVAQVVAQLTSLDGRPAAKSSRALMLRTNAWSLRSLALAPLRWVGLARDTRTVRVPLFTNYREKREVPFMAAHLAVKTRNPSWSAEVVSATLRVQLRLGLVRRLLYTLRPRPLPLLLLGGAALAAFLGGAAAAVVFLALLLYAGLGGGGEAAAVQDEVSSNQSADAEVSSADDVSEASSSLLREAGEEPPSPRQHPGMRTAGSPPGARKPGRRPVDSAMGSEAGAAAAVGLLRRRGGSSL